MCGVDVGDVFVVEQVFDFVYFEFVLGEVGVVIVGFVFVVNCGEVIGVDGQVEQFVFVLFEGVWQLQVFYVFFC